MQGVSYHFLMFFLFTCLGAYLNRDRFRNLERSITGGLYLPSWVVALIFSVLFGFGVWALVEIVLWQGNFSFFK